MNEPVRLQRARRLFPGVAVLSFSFFMVLLWECLTGGAGGHTVFFLQHSNLVQYILSLVLYICCFFFLYCIVWLLPPKTMSVQTSLDRTMGRSVYYTIIGIAIAVFSVLLIHRRMISELQDFGVTITDITVHQISPVAAVLLLVGSGILVVIIAAKAWDISAKLLWLGYAAICVLAFMAALVTNVFHADIHHGTAYLESIYNVYYGTPYIDVTTGIYGHYGLLLAPILHIFSGSNLAMMYTIAGLSVAVTVLCIYCIHNLVKDNYIRILGVLACSIAVLTMRQTNYWQVQPHRVLWPLIMMAYLVCLTKRNWWNWYAVTIGYGLCTVAVVWNTESGLFCSIAFAAACVVHEWQRKTIFAHCMLMKYVLHIGAVIGTLVAAIGIVNVYNYLRGYREIELKSFFFPMFESTYMQGTLEYDMILGNNAWIYVLVLFALLLMFGFYQTRFFHTEEALEQKKGADKAPIAVAISTLGFCNFSYYANRAAYLNLDIVVQTACVGICLLWGLFSDDLRCKRKDNLTVKKMIRQSLALISLLVISALAAQSICFAPAMLKRKYEAGHYDQTAFQEGCATIAENIPENTFAFGGGISVFYAELGWDPVAHYRDMPDMKVGDDEAINELVGHTIQQDSFVVYHTSTLYNEEFATNIILALCPEFEMIKELDINGKSLQYYVKK